MTVAVAPALNQSGSTDFDPERFADVMASELTYVEGIDVIPVSRVLGALRAQDRQGIESAAHALQLRDLLGADAILVFSVTEYDPYDPPSIGISAQLYGSTRDLQPGRLDPVAFSRRASFGASSAAPSRDGLLAQAQRTFDAGHEDVVRAIKGFAGLRTRDNDPYGWRRYVVIQQEFIRFCCHETLRRMMSASEPEADGGDR